MATVSGISMGTCSYECAESMALLRYTAACGGLFSVLLDSISVQKWCVSGFVSVEWYCSCSIRTAYLLEVGSFRTLCVAGRLLLRLYCNIAIVCVVRRTSLLLIKVRRCFSLASG